MRRFCASGPSSICARGPTPLLFLLDEILGGTNSHDRRIGAEAIVRILVDTGAIGLVTTHDLALTELASKLGPLDGKAPEGPPDGKALEASSSPTSTSKIASRTEDGLRLQDAAGCGRAEQRARAHASGRAGRVTREDDTLRLRITVMGHRQGSVCNSNAAGTSSKRRSKFERSMTFEFEVRVGTRARGEPNFLGPFVQGPPAGRFVYINSGTLAGQADSIWTRRAKVPLTGITRALIERARVAGSTLEAEIAGTGRDGGPVCATVPLMSDGWRVADGD